MQTAFAGTGVELSDGSLAASPASDRAGDVHGLCGGRHAELVRHSCCGMGSTGVGTCIRRIW
ncbi:hypothetical protein GCM10020220_065380 [Nonomuraea rubra]